MLLKEEKQSILNHFKQNELDSGSPEVQVALLTFRIKGLIEHFNKHKKDKHSQKGLLKMISQRRKLLEYLKKRDTSRYFNLIQSLELRK